MSGLDKRKKTCYACFAWGTGQKLSTDEQIREIYEYDIGMMTYLVEKKFGKQPFYDNFKGMAVRKNKSYDPAQTKYQGEK